MKAHLRMLGLRRQATAAQTSHHGQPPKAIALTVVTNTVRRGNRAGTLSSEELPGGTLFPVIGCITSQMRKRTVLWLYKDDQDKIPRGSLGMTKRSQNSLRIEPDQRVAVEFPQSYSFSVRLPAAADLPIGTSIHVHPDIYQAFRKGWYSRTAYALLTTDKGLSVPVRLHKRPLTGNYVLCPMLVRTLCGLREGDTVQLSVLARVPLWKQASWFTNRVFARRPRRPWVIALGCFLGGCLLTVRLFDFLVELILRATLRSQPLSFRVIQANPGDDDLRDTIRLHPGAFPALALSPGGQVILNWAGQHMAVRALEDHNPVDAPASVEVLSSVGLRLDTGLLPDGFPAHLVTRIPAPVRQALNIPPGTAIEMRRRLRPAVISQLNQLTIPIAGLILAAAAFPTVRGWPLVAGALAAVALGLAPLRMPRPPRGHWP